MNAFCQSCRKVTIRKKHIACNLYVKIVGVGYMQWGPSPTATLEWDSRLATTCSMDDAPFSTDVLSENCSVAKWLRTPQLGPADTRADNETPDPVAC